MKQVVTFVLLISIISCMPSKQEVVGKYVAQNYKNTFDTILILDGGLYERKVYDRKNELVLKMKGSWEYSNQLLTLNSFFLNFDRDLELYPELLSDTTMVMEVLLTKNLNGLKFCTGHFENENCYTKIRN